MSIDSAELLVDGPWRHRFVSANGARFHLAEAGDGPLVMLLHGFPQFWWAWRDQLPALAQAGYRVAAMDLRGFGASDKPPRGYDTITLATDVAGVVRALGESRAVIVGHDLGAWTAWSMPTVQPGVTRAIGAVSMAHPLTMRAAYARHQRQRRAGGRLLRFQVPMLPERRLTTGDGVRDILTAWSGPGFPDQETLRRYQRAMQVPFVSHTSMEYYRWAVRSLGRQDGRRFAAAIRHRIEVPVLQLHGGLDPWVLPETAAASSRWVGGDLTQEVFASAGHFLPEEAPEQVTAALLEWLTKVSPVGS